MIIGSLMQVLMYEPEHWRARLNRAVTLLGKGELQQGAYEIEYVHAMLGRSRTESTL